MNYFDFIMKSCLLFIGYMMICFAAKLIIMLPMANSMQGGDEGFYFSLLITLGLVGLFFGSLCTKIIQDIPLYGALVLAILVTSYKRFVPDLSPLPHSWHSLSLVVSFISIMLGAYIQKRKA